MRKACKIAVPLIAAKVVPQAATAAWSMIAAIATLHLRPVRSRTAGRAAAHGITAFAILALADTAARSMVPAGAGALTLDPSMNFRCHRRFKYEMPVIQGKMELI
ncbi:hypothetical protein [Paeniglutamicibacter cryotolerans]